MTLFCRAARQHELEFILACGRKELWDFSHERSGTPKNFLVKIWARPHVLTAYYVV